MIWQKIIVKWKFYILIGSLLLTSCIPLVTMSELEVFSFAVDDTNADIFQPLAEEFNAQSAHSKVVLVPLAYDIDPGDWVAHASAADTVTLPVNQAITSSRGSYFLDLQPLIETDANFAVDDLWPGVLTACQDEEGHILGIPLNLEIQGIFYFPEVFDALGLPYPQPGWTWNDFSQTVQALAVTQPTTDLRYGYVDLPNSNVSILTPWIDASLAQNNNSINPEELAASLQWYIDLTQSNMIYNWPSPSLIQSLFTEKRVAMWNGTLSSAFFNEGRLETALLNAGFVPYPVLNGALGQGTTPFSATCLGISSGTLHSQAAWEWLAFLSQQAGTTSTQQGWDVIPARQSLTESQGYWQRLPAAAEPAVRFALQHLNNHYNHRTAADIILSTVYDMTLNNTDLNTVLTGVQAELQVLPPNTRHTVEITVAPPPEDMGDLTVIKFGGFNTADSDHRAFWGTDENSLRVLFRAVHPESVIMPVYISIQGSEQDPYSFLTENSDCFTYYNDANWDSQRASQLLDLTPFWESEDEAFRQDFTAALLNRYRYEGLLLGLPHYAIPRVIVYNETLLLRLGLQIPEPDWTFDQFIELISQVAAGDTQKQSYGFLYTGASELFLNGQGVVGYDLTVSPPILQLNSSEMITATAWLQHLVDTRAIYPAVSGDYLERADLIKLGQVAFWDSLPGTPGGGYAFPPFAYQTGELPYPVVAGQNGGPGAVQLDKGLFIPRSSTDPQACWDWIKFLSGQPSSVGGGAYPHDTPWQNLRNGK